MKIEIGYREFLLSLVWVYLAARLVCYAIARTRKENGNKEKEAEEVGGSKEVQEEGTEETAGG